MSVHDDIPVVRSPSGLALQHLITNKSGSTQIYLGRQWLKPGDRVLDHTHPVEEVLYFLDGHGELRVNSEPSEIGPGTHVHIPAGIVHGFSNTGNEELHLLIVFPVPYFAETIIVEAK